MSILQTIFIAFIKGFVDFIVYKLTKVVTLQTIFPTYLTTPALSLESSKFNKSKSDARESTQDGLINQVVDPKADNDEKVPD